MLTGKWQRPPLFVLKYYAYRATVTFGFFWPVFTIFLLDRGLSYTQIGLLNSLSAGIIVIGEIPSGYIGDRIGRRNSILVGSGLLSVSLIGFTVVKTFLAFAVLWVFWGLGSAFQSGSDDAWLYEALEDRSDESQYTRIRGRGGSVNQWMTAGTTLVAGGLYSLNPRLPFLAGGLLVASSIPVLLSLPKAGENETEDDRFTVLDALPVLRRRLTQPPLRSFVVYMALFFGIISAADEFIQPIATQALFLSPTGLGPLYAGFTVTAAIASYFAGDIEKLLSTQWAILLVPTLVGVFFIVPLLAPLAAFPLFFVMKSANVVVRPIATNYINRHAESVGRATILSAASMAYALVRLPMKPLSGVVADATTPIAAVAALGGVFLLGGTIVVLWETPVSDIRGKVSESTD
ncbi:MFS transporter [Halococcus hamelinensis]|uniref:Major Facilitator Superfamily transporter n=1 Tax=Halococcus hamelinensis 100A6 TaxID=1132509 RepID=M0M8B6_9EURY|nr:MFS transporter [Halococcus hamelinensis]EMA41971.1 Major Facilitator Superfamily transporter [Halococcus hamelinensis 100A6]